MESQEIKKIPHKGLNVLAVDLLEKEAQQTIYNI